MRQITVNLYQFDELSDEAKERAREWYRDASADDEWWDDVYMDAEQVHIKIDGFDVYRGEIEGHFTAEPHEVADKILEEHGESCETYQTAAGFLARRDQLIDEWPRDEDGELDNTYELDQELDALENEFKHDILEDYRIMLQREMDYIASDENVDECIRINEYEFTKEGKRA